MDIRDAFMASREFLDLERCGKLDNAALDGQTHSSMTSADLDRLLSAKTDAEFESIAEKYAFYGEAMELACDFSEGASENRARAAAALSVNATGYRDMQRHMEKAIHLKELCSKKRVTFDDLSDAGIEMSFPTTRDLFDAAYLEMSCDAVLEEFDGFGSALLRENRSSAQKLRLPRFSCREYATNLDSPYSQHLCKAIGRMQHEQGTAFDFSETQDGVSFDLICDHFPDSEDGYRMAAQTALDRIFAINLNNMRIITKQGLIHYESPSVYPELWYYLSRRLEDGRAMRCEACNKPFITFGERGMKRRYCNDTCRRWAHRHPGEKRSKR